MKASLHRPSKAVIDLAAIAFNIRQLKSGLSLKPMLMVMELLRFLGILSPS